MLRFSARRIVSIVAVFSMALGLLLIAGCSAPEKPKELVEIERILADENARKVGQVPGAGKYFREARQYRQEARNSYNDKQIERAREYAVLAKLRYRTAEAIQKQYEVKERLDEANARVNEINPKVETANQERNKLQQDVNQLERDAARARNAHAREEQRKEALEKASMDRHDDTSAAEERAVKNKIDSAHKAKEEAIDVRANDFAKGAFNRAENRLKSTMSMFEDGSNDPDDIIDSADKAIDAFRDAASEARPKYREHQAKMKPAERRSTLREEASRTFGDPYVEQEPKGARVILAKLFESDSSTVRPSAERLVDEVAKLAEEYDEADLRVEGYTRSGDATQNLATSQVRAKEVADMLEEQGIDKSRLSTSGKGQDRLRYEGDPGKNDRVEVVFRISD